MDLILNIQTGHVQRMYIAEELEYKLRTDLCQPTQNYESFFIEIENKNKNVIVGVVLTHQLIVSLKALNLSIERLIQIINISI